MSDYRRVRIVVTGTVQGVGYRFFAVHLARQLNISGWVRNRDDGAVEALAEGEAGMLSEFVTGLRRGPGAADVRGVDATPEPYTGEYRRFEVRF